MDTQKLLGEFAGKLLSGGIEVVDLSAVLGPDTPLIKLPPDLAVDTPKIEIHAISAYDKNGPCWAWNWLKLGEHSGTHFDAPIHWITGKDYRDGATDTIPVAELRCAGQRHRLLEGSRGTTTSCSPSTTSRPGKLSTAPSKGRVGGDAHRLVQAQRSGGEVPQRQRDRPAFARTDRRKRSNI